MRYSGTVALVFGASAEGGSGWTIAETLAREGAKVIVSARSIDGVRRLADRIGGFAMRCDVADEDQVSLVAKAAASRHGQIDMVINAAGQPFASTVLESSAADLLRATAINYFGPFFVIKHCAPLVREGGAISIITSLAGTNVVDGQIIYGCAKAATNMLVKYAALELGPRQIRVNAIVPGMIVSPMVRDMFADAPDVLEVYLKEIPLHRGASPQEIANAAIWLASKECFANGALFHVDGGNHLTRQPLLTELPAHIMSKIK
jgi:NAD(P)-dependent dehydrogenase (short-subunit alcohol dehydrogenase family)